MLVLVVLFLDANDDNGEERLIDDENDDVLLVSAVEDGGDAAGDAGGDAAGDATGDGMNEYESWDKIKSLSSRFIAFELFWDKIRSSLSSCSSFSGSFSSTVVFVLLCFLVFLRWDAFWKHLLILFNITCFQTESNVSDWDTSW